MRETARKPAMSAKTVGWLAVVFLHLCGNANTIEVVTTCQAPSVLTGQTARVTCDFNVSVSDIRPAHYGVDFYPSGSDSPDEIAECTNVHSEQLSCSAKRPGEVFKTTQDPNELVLEIPKAAAIHAGRYVCKLSASQVNTRQQPCSLMVEEHASTTPPVGVTRSPAKESDKSTLWIIIGASAGGGLLVIIVICVVVLLLIRRRRNLQNLDVEKSTKNSKEAERLNPPGTPKQAPLVQPPNEALRAVREVEEVDDAADDDPFIAGDDDDIADEEGVKEKYKVRRRSSALSEEVEVVAAAKQIGVKRKMRDKEFPWDGSVEDLRLKNV